MLVLKISHLLECEIIYPIYPLAPHIFSLLSVKPLKSLSDGYITDQSVNTSACKDFCKYESIQDALSIIQPGLFMAIVDLKSAYRSVHIRPMEHAITGLQWKFHNDSDPIIMCNTRFPFGARKSPAIFNRITQAVARFLRRNGHHVVVYLEDFFVCDFDFDSYKSTFDTLIMTLCGLGFQINWNKILDPTQQLVFLGVQIDTVAGLLSLKAEKLHDFVDLLDSFKQRKHGSRKQLESLAGKLCWAAHVVP